ncbi:MAG: putative membrane protein YdgH [Actinobacteria bacterium ADurb.Bin346]|nr:MAG: putative membrane protein YdgH [Actinobacteria bacterium ADurb.Bin346]
MTDQFRNSEYSFFIVQVKTGVEDDETIKAIDDINKYASQIYGRNFYLTGESVLLNDMSRQSQIDMKYVNYLSIGLVALIIAVSFRSLSIPIILVAVIQLAIWLNLSIPYISGKPVYFLTSIFIGAIQLGTTVDYAILLTSRYKENLALLEPVEAMKKTIKDTGQSIFTSALILFGGTLGITLISKIKTTSELTNMIGRGALLSMAIIFFGLPALLLIFEKIIGWTTLGWRRRNKNKGKP